MAIREHYDQICDVHRLGAGAGDVEEYQEHLSEIPCMRQPLEEAASQDLQGSFGKDFLLFMPPNDVAEGDRIVIGAETYRVTGLESYEFLGEPRHMELRIRRFHD